VRTSEVDWAAAANSLSKIKLAEDFESEKRQQTSEGWQSPDCKEKK
jgi:hypothetical protein